MVRKRCSKCFRRLTSVGKPCLLHSGGTTIVQRTAVEDNLNPTEQESPKESRASSGSKSPLIPNDEHMAKPNIHDKKSATEDLFKTNEGKDNKRSKIFNEQRVVVRDNSNPTEQASPEESRTSIGSKSPLIPKNVQMAKPQTYDIKRSAKEDRIISGESKHNKIPKSANKQLRINYDFERKIKEMQTASVKSNSDGNYSKFLINKTSRVKNQGMQDSLKKTTKKYKASKFDILQNTQNDNPPKEISNSKLSKGESIPSNVDSFAVPGPSGLTKNKNTSKICAKKLQSKSSLGDQSEGASDKSKLTCRKCKREISDHTFEIAGRHLYKCCVCNYRNENECNLHLHTNYISCRSAYRVACNICDELMWRNEWHANKQTCAICRETFQCMTQLSKHVLDHKKFYKHHCRICRRKLSEHIDPEENKTYVCCKCGNGYSKGTLKEHLHIHTGIRLFKCDLCDMRFSQQTTLRTHEVKHYKCEKKLPSKKSCDVHYKKQHT